MPKLLPRQYAKILLKLTTEKSSKDLDLAIIEYLNFLKNERAFSKLDHIKKEFIDLAKEKEGIKMLEVISAFDIDKKNLERLAKQFGDKVEITQRQDKSLLGGVIVKTRNKIFDASLKTQLKKIKQSI